MTTRTTSLGVAASAAVASFVLFSPTIAVSAPGTLSESPLFLTNAVEPNVLFVIDDSGSMDWELMTTDDGTLEIGECSFAYAQPASDHSLLGAGWEMTPTEAALKDEGIRSPYGGVWRAWNKDYNRIYYDPAVTYIPWTGRDSLGNAYTNATPTAALHDPYVPSVGSLDLTAETSYETIYGDECDDDEPSTFTVSKFYPARYQVWTDTDGDGVVDATDAHTLVEIRSTTATYTSGSTRSDCAAAPVCTYAEEIQNFANWYSYYRRREFVAKAAYGQVVSGAGNSRMGVVTLHNNGSVNTAIASMNADPTTGDKAALLTSLYSIQSSGDTPLRKSLNNAGKYLSCDSNDFFSSCPALGENSGGACQQNFAVVMTDGYYNGSFSGVGNADGDNDTRWDSGRSGPFGDRRSNTLADIAMKYYEDDIRPSVPDKLVPPPGGIDENTEQHVVTYTVAFGVDGSISAMPPNTTDPFRWPRTDTNAGKIDDLRHAAWNGRGEFLSAQNPTELIDGLDSALSSIQSRSGSASSVAFNTGSLSTNSEVYLALFNSQRWDGDLLAFDLDPTTGDISTMASWSAADELDSRDLANDARTLLTYDGSDGIPFQWSSLTTAQKNDFQTNPSGAQDNEATGMARHGYIRGDRGCELNSTAICSYSDGTNTYNTKAFRERGGRLGDIVHSGPVFAGAPESNWPDVAPFPSTTGNTYTEFRTAQASRAGVIYVGGNDGMLHGFSQATGEELLGYVPGALYSTTALDGLHYLTNSAYTHKYSVDLTPSLADAYIKTTTSGATSWKTVLVGGLRAGGTGLFALDVTDPSVFSESGSRPADTVMWEFTQSDDADLGHTFSRPSIVPLEGSE